MLTDAGTSLRHNTSASGSARFWKSWYIGYECIRDPVLLPLCAPRWWSITSSSGAATGSLRSRIWSISVNIAVLAPIPNASDRIATIEKRGLRRSPRTASRRSENDGVIVLLGRGEPPEGWLGLMFWLAV